MARVEWPLAHDRPAIDIVLTRTQDGRKLARTVLADTGASTAKARFEFILDDGDCLACGEALTQTLTLGGAYSGSFPRYIMRVEIPQLDFDDFLFVIGVPLLPAGLDGIACFCFLNRFTYGNFGDPNQFGLEE